MSEERVWRCKIGGVTPNELPGGSDLPMRQAVEEAFLKITGVEAQFLFSGWGARVSALERAVINGDDDAALQAAENL